jgi:hypothetical protein
MWELKVYSLEFGVLLCSIRASGVGEAKAEADAEVGAAMAYLSLNSTNGCYRELV